MAEPRRFQLDDLRRWAAALAINVGVPAHRAGTLATELLWFDAAGAAQFGVSSFPTYLERIVSGEIDPAVEPRVGPERGATAVLDGRDGLPLLALSRAAEIAGEKARETGVGLVRLTNVGPIDSGASAASGLAVGPNAAAVVGPGGAFSIALPSDEGLPAVFDPSLAAKGNGKGQAAAESLIAPWAGALATEGGWLVLAISVVALGSLESFHRGAADAIVGLGEGDGRLLPGPWEARRKAARERGIAVAAGPLKALRSWSERLGVEPPRPE